MAGTGKELADLPWIVTGQPEWLFTGYWPIWGHQPLRPPTKDDFFHWNRWRTGSWQRGGTDNLKLGALGFYVKNNRLLPWLCHFSFGDIPCSKHWRWQFIFKEQKTVTFGRLGLLLLFPPNSRACWTFTFTLNKQPICITDAHRSSLRPPISQKNMISLIFLTFTWDFE